MQEAGRFESVEFQSRVARVVCPGQPVNSITKLEFLSVAEIVGRASEIQSFLFAPWRRSAVARLDRLLIQAFCPTAGNGELEIRCETGRVSGSISRRRT